MRHPSPRSVVEYRWQLYCNCAAKTPGHCRPRGRAQAVEEGRVKVIAVQPDWFDPSPLLGSDRPLQQSYYRRTPFLDLLLSAEDNPSQPYVAIRRRCHCLMP